MTNTLESDSMRVVLADDNRDAADLLTMMVEADGHTVFTVYDGDAAVRETLDRHADLALLDINMPGKTGYEAAAEIQAASPRTLLVAVSALPPRYKTISEIGAGFHEYILKPFDVTRLLRIIRELKKRRDASEL
jgi:two-component system CheB/CheR fusion protein